MSETLREKVAPVVLALGVLMPALMVAGFMPLWNVLPVAGWAGVAAVSGAVGGALLPERGRAAAGVMGFLGAPLLIGAIVLYVDLRAAISDTYFTIEFLIPGAVVAGPLIALHTRLYPAPKLLPPSPAAPVAPRNPDPPEAARPE